MAEVVDDYRQVRIDINDDDASNQDQAEEAEF
jgi:hypothetical protein